MRSFLLAISLGIFVAATADAQVKLVVNRDGSKSIVNMQSNDISGARGDLRTLARMRNRRSAYDPLIERYSAQYGVDPVLVRAVIQVESDFNPNCVSGKGARGLMQLLPETARRYGSTRLHDPEENIRAGVAYLAALLSMFSNDLSRTLAAYNAGENAVIRYRGVPPYKETTNYVARALSVYYGSPYGQATGFSGGRGGRKLKGGFTNDVVAPALASLRSAVAPAADAVVPRMRYLGTLK
jgi:soluble lytic murein transglycosylase-like protein